MTRYRSRRANFLVSFALKTLFAYTKDTLCVSKSLDTVLVSRSPTQISCIGNSLDHYQHFKALGFQIDIGSRLLIDSFHRLEFRSSFLVCFGSCFSGGIGRRRDNGGMEMTTAHTEMTIATTTTTTSTAAAAVKHLSPSSNGTDKEKAASAVARNGSAV